MAEPVRVAEWTLTGHALDRLLLLLDADRDRAGEKYESLRRKLIAFFEYRGCRGAEDRADETINRVARRLEQGETIQVSDPFWYFMGVARNVAREHHAAEQRERRALEAHGSSSVQAFLPGQDAREQAGITGCVRRCLQQLPPNEKALIIDYYRGAKATRIANRQKIAARLQLGLNALRIRAHRIRQRLEECIQSCVERQAK